MIDPTKANKEETSIPQFHALFNPLLLALRSLGGSGSNEEIFETVSRDIPEAVLQIPHKADDDSRSEVEYRLAWAKTYLKKYGLITNSSRGVWALTPEAAGYESVNPTLAIATVKGERTSTPADSDSAKEIFSEAEEMGGEAWRTELHHLLTHELSFDGFERLVKRILRESGFVQVEVTGRSGDGGIDGTGIMKLAGLLSFHVIFQCKRYKGSVSSPEIRNFRGAMTGRTDKGLFVTTGTFTRSAIQEATRDGAPPIELVDGTQLAEMLKNLKLGVTTEMVEKVSIDPDWFMAI